MKTTTNVRVAYDIIVGHCVEDSKEFGACFYEAIRDGKSIEDAVKDYLMEYVGSDEAPAILRRAKCAFESYGDMENSIVNEVAAILIDVWSPSVALGLDGLVNAINHRDNMKMGFITVEECANKILDEIHKVLAFPSVWVIDQVFDMLGLPSSMECLNTKRVYIARR